LSPPLDPGGFDSDRGDLDGPLLRTGKFVTIIR